MMNDYGNPVTDVSFAEENAVDLTCSLIGLQNNYDIEDFDRNVLEAVTALVVSWPRKVAP